MKQASICVVGNGPAALSATLAAARRGTDVVLIRPRAGESRQESFGETLSNRALQPISKLGIIDAFRACAMPVVTTTSSSWGSGLVNSKFNFLHPSGSGWIFNRRDFELVALRSIDQQGIPIVNGTFVSAHRADNRWVARASEGNHSLSINCHLIILATGRDAPGTFHLPSRVTVDKLVAVVATIEEPLPSSTTGITIGSLESGWFFSVCHIPGQRVISYFTDGDLLLAKQETEHLEFLRNVIPSIPSMAGIIDLSKTDRLASFEIFSANTTFRRSAWTGGVVTCGDLSQTFDPLSSQGIVWAMEDGIAAAHLCGQMLEGDGDAVTRNEIRRRQIFLNYLKERRAVYLSENRWPRGIFWQRRISLEPLKKFAEKVRVSHLQTSP